MPRHIGTCRYFDSHGDLPNPPCIYRVTSPSTSTHSQLSHILRSIKHPSCIPSGARLQDYEDDGKRHSSVQAAPRHLTSTATTHRHIRLRERMAAYMWSYCMYPPHSYHPQYPTTAHSPPRDLLRSTYYSNERKRALWPSTYLQALLTEIRPRDKQTVKDLSVLVPPLQPFP